MSRWRPLVTPPVLNIPYTGLKILSVAAGNRSMRQKAMSQQYLTPQEAKALVAYILRSPPCQDPPASGPGH